MSISDRLQMVIKMNGMTNASFADTIGVQRSSISHVLSGRNKPSIDFIQKILETFPKVDANWLVAGRKVGQTPSQTEIVPESTSIEHSDTIIKDEDRTIYNTKSDKERTNIESPSKKRGIDKIIVFYTDGSFEELSKGN